MVRSSSSVSALACPNFQEFSSTILDFPNNIATAALAHRRQVSGQPLATRPLPPQLPLTWLSAQAELKHLYYHIGRLLGLYVRNFPPLSSLLPFELFFGAGELPLARPTTQMTFPRWGGSFEASPDPRCGQYHQGQTQVDSCGIKQPLSPENNDKSKPKTSSAGTF